MPTWVKHVGWTGAALFPLAIALMLLGALVFESLDLITLGVIVAFVSAGCLAKWHATWKRYRHLKLEYQLRSNARAAAKGGAQP